MPFTHLCIPRLAMALLMLAIWTTPALAAGAAGPATAEAQQRYRQDMAACNNGQTSQPIAACRLEARNALKAARRGALTGSDDYERNARVRCQAHAGADRSACEARMDDDAARQGSVEGGGILRKSVTVVPGS